MLINWRMGKYILAYPYNEILCNNRNEQTTLTHNTMYEPHKQHAEQKQPDLNK